MDTEDKKLIEAQNKRIALLEDHIESIYRELSSIRGVTGSILKETGMVPVVVMNGK